MSVNYTEKRNFIRMNTESRITYKILGSNDAYHGTCINLSAAGVLFTSSQQVPLGTKMEINITPELKLTGPLNATIEVVRSQVNDNGSYAIAGQITSFR